MDIRNSVDGLKTLLGVPAAQAEKMQPAKTGQASGAAELTGDRATLSSAGASVQEASSASDVRMDKVNAVKAAIGAGTYSVPSEAVAGKVIDAMLGGKAGE